MRARAARHLHILIWLFFGAAIHFASSETHAQNLLSLRIQNGTEGRIELFWRNYNGGLDAMAQVPAGQYVDRQTYETHQWVAKQNGKIIAEYTVGPGAKQVFPIGDPQAAANTKAPQQQQRVTVEFSNQTAKPVELFWRNAEGHLVPHGTIQPGQAFIQSAYPAQRWMAKQGNAILREYVVTKQASQAVTLRPPGSDRPTLVKAANVSSQTVSVFNTADPKRQAPITRLLPGTQVELKSWPGLVWVFSVGDQIIETLVTQGRGKNEVLIDNRNLPLALRPAPPREDQMAADQTNTPENAEACPVREGTPKRLSRPKLEAAREASNNPFSFMLRQSAGVSAKYQMDDGNCAIHYEFEQFQVAPFNASIQKYVGTDRAPFDLQFTPEARAWIENGDLFLSIDLGTRFSLQFNGSTVQYNVSRGGKYGAYDREPAFIYGPFLERLRVNFQTPAGFEVQDWYPRTKMRMASVSETRGKSISSNFALSPLLEMSQFGIAKGQNFDTTVGGEHEDFEILHQRGHDSQSFSFVLCRAGISGSASGASAPCPYQKPENLIAEDWTDGLGAVDYVSGVYPVPATAFNFEVGRSIVVYRVPAYKLTASSVRVPIQLAVGTLSMKARDPIGKASGALGDRYGNVSANQRFVALTYNLDFDVSQLTEGLAQ